MKMKKVFWPIVAVAMIVLSLHLASCDRDVEPEKIPISSVSPAKTAEYSCNPYDFVGLHHNQFLDFLSRVSDVGNLTIQDIFEASRSFSQSVFGVQDTLTLEETEEYLINNEVLVDNLIHRNEDYSVLLSEPFLISIMDEFTEEMNHILQTSFLMPPQEFWGIINSLEDQVLAEGQYSDPEEESINEHAQVLAALAIARYSYDYWYNVVTNPDSPWHYYANKGAKEANCRIWRLICDVVHTVKADVVGFFGDTNTPVDPQKPEEGGVSTGVSCSRAGKASAHEWEQCKNVEYDENGNRYYRS